MFSSSANLLCAAIDTKDAAAVAAAIAAGSSPRDGAGYAAKIGCRAVMACLVAALEERGQLGVLLQSSSNQGDHEDAEWCPLAAAASLGHHAAVQTMLAAFSPQHLKCTSDGRIALEAALLAAARRPNQPNLLRMLLNAGAPWHCALCSAANLGCMENLRALLDWVAVAQQGQEAEEGNAGLAALLNPPEPDSEAKAKDLHCPVALAARQGHEAAVHLLLDRAPQPTPQQWSVAMFEAVRCPGNDGILRLMLERGADPRVPVRRLGDTPLAEAGANGCERNMRVLLGWLASQDDCAALLRPAPGVWFSPAAQAATSGNMALLVEVLECAPSPKPVQWNELLHAVLSVDEKTNKPVPNSGEVLQLLRQHGADPLASERGGHCLSPLHQAVREGDLGNLKVLLAWLREDGLLATALSKLSKDGETPLQLAKSVVEIDHRDGEEVVRLLRHAAAGKMTQQPQQVQQRHSAATRRARRFVLQSDSDDDGDDEAVENDTSTPARTGSTSSSGNPSPVGPSGPCGGSGQSLHGACPQHCVPNRQRSAKRHRAAAQAPLTPAPDAAVGKPPGQPAASPATEQAPSAGGDPAARAAATDAEASGRCPAAAEATEAASGSATQPSTETALTAAQIGTAAAPQSPTVPTATALPALASAAAAASTPADAVIPTGITAAPIVAPATTTTPTPLAAAAAPAVGVTSTSQPYAGMAPPPPLPASTTPGIVSLPPPAPIPAGAAAAPGANSDGGVGTRPPSVTCHRMAWGYELRAADLTADAADAALDTAEDALDEALTPGTWSWVAERVRGPGNAPGTSSIGNASGGVLYSWLLLRLTPTDAAAGRGSSGGTRPRLPAAVQRRVAEAMEAAMAGVAAASGCP